jgi:hypothetical protein
MTYRYLYLGDALTMPALVGRMCNPLLRTDGRCILSNRMATALVLFAGETRPRVVVRRRLRLVSKTAIVSKTGIVST